MNDVLLIGDVGGTNARLAVAYPDQPGYHSETTLACADFDTPELALRHYLDDNAIKVPAMICLAVAGPVVDGRVSFTNSQWQVDQARLAQAFGTDKTTLVNDFEAAAIGLPLLSSGQLRQIGDAGLPAVDSARCLAIMGPGTGLGAAALLRHGESWQPLVTEAGHAGFSPTSPLQSDINKLLLDRFGRVSTERLVSGPGIENIYAALAKFRENREATLRAEDIFEQVGFDALAKEAVNVFFEVFGAVAGDFVLNTGAYDGVFLAGGVAQRYGEWLASSRFREAFEDKGRLARRLKATPTAVVLHPNPGLLGASVVARQMLI